MPVLRPAVADDMLHSYVDCTRLQRNWQPGQSSDARKRTLTGLARPQPTDADVLRHDQQARAGLRRSFVVLLCIAFACAPPSLRPGVRGTWTGNVCYLAQPGAPLYNKSSIYNEKLRNPLIEQTQRTGPYNTTLAQRRQGAGEGTQCECNEKHERGASQITRRQVWPGRVNCLPGLARSAFSSHPGCP